MDGYEIIKKLGCGSYGQALLAEKKGEKGNCVIKEIKVSHLDSKDLDNAKKEVKVLSSLLYSHITKFYDSFENNDCLYIVMEHCGGGDLQQLIDSRRGIYFPESRILDWFIQLCLAVKFIHQRHIIHRDIKAQNVFLTEEGRVKLGDFGIAKILDKTSDLANTCIGTPYYLSPEMCENKPYSNKSDIWAVGCVLYEMAALKHAFDASNIKALVIKIINSSYDPLPSRYSRDLKILIQQIFQRYPKCRPSINSILSKNLIAKRLPRFVTEAEAEELNVSRAKVPKAPSLSAKRNALRSRIGISSPAAKYISTPKINVSYPNVTRVPKSPHSPKVNLISKSKNILDTYENPINISVNKISSGVPLDSGPLQGSSLINFKNKISRLHVKKRHSQRSKCVAKEQSNFLPVQSYRSNYINESTKWSCNSERHSKMDLIINESSDCFKKIDVSNSILSNLNKLEHPLYGTDLQNSSSWLVDLYLSKKMVNLKNDLKNSRHCDTKQIPSNYLSDILTDIQQHKYCVPTDRTNESRKKNKISDRVNYIVNEDIKKICKVVQNRRKSAYEDEKCSLESTYKNLSASKYSTPLGHSATNSMNEDHYYLKKKDNIYNVPSLANQSKLCKLLNNGCLVKEATNVSQYQKQNTYVKPKEYERLPFDLKQFEIDDKNVLNDSSEEIALQNRKQWSNGPNDIVSILSSAKLLDGRMSMESCGRQSITRNDIQIMHPICFSSESIEHNSTDFKNCKDEMKNEGMRKTYNIVSSDDVKGNLSLNESEKTFINMEKNHTLPTLSFLDLEKSNTCIDEKNLSDKLKEEISLSNDNNSLIDNKKKSDTILKTNSGIPFLNTENSYSFYCEKQTKDICSIKNEISLGNYVMMVSPRKELKNDTINISETEKNSDLLCNDSKYDAENAHDFISTKKPKRRFLSFLQCNSNIQQTGNLTKIKSSESDVSNLSTPKSKARFSAILKKFLQKESQKNVFTSFIDSCEEKIDSCTTDIVLSSLSLELKTENNEKENAAKNSFSTDCSLFPNQKEVVESSSALLCTEKMNSTKDSGVESCLTNSTLYNGTDTSTGALQGLFIDKSSNFIIPPILPCSPGPIDIKYISGVEIQVGTAKNAESNLIKNTDLLTESMVKKGSFENTFITNKKGRNISIDSNNDYSTNTLKNHDFPWLNIERGALRETAFNLVEDVFKTAIKKLEEKHLVCNESLNSDTHNKKFKSPAFTPAIQTSWSSKSQFCKFDHHENIKPEICNISDKNVLGNKSSLEILEWSDNTTDSHIIKQDESTPLNNKHISSLLKWENISLESPIKAWEDEARTVTTLDSNTTGKDIITHVYDGSHHENRCQSSLEFNLPNHDITNKVDVSVLEDISTIDCGDPLFVKGKWIKIPSLKSSVSEDTQDVASFRQSLENLLLSDDDEVFEKETLKMSVSADALQLCTPDGDVHGWIEELRAKLEDVLGLELFIKAYRCLECAFEQNCTNLKEVLFHVKKMIGPINEQMANDILQLIVTESVHLN